VSGTPLGYGLLSSPGCCLRERAAGNDPFRDLLSEWSRALLGPAAAGLPRRPYTPRMPLLAKSCDRCTSIVAGFMLEWEPPIGLLLRWSLSPCEVIGTIEPWLVLDGRTPSA